MGSFIVTVVCVADKDTFFFWTSQLISGKNSSVPFWWLEGLNTFSNSNVFITLQNKVGHNRSVLVKFNDIFKISVQNNVYSLCQLFCEVSETLPLFLKFIYAPPSSKSDDKSKKADQGISLFILLPVYVVSIILIHGSHA